MTFYLIESYTVIAVNKPDYIAYNTLYYRNLHNANDDFFRLKNRLTHIPESHNEGLNNPLYLCGDKLTLKFLIQNLVLNNIFR